MKLFLAIGVYLALVPSVLCQPKYVAKDLGAWEGVALNNSGTVVGWNNQNLYEGFLYDGRILRTFIQNVAVEGINDSGEIIGQTEDGGRGWVYRRGNVTVFPPDVVLSGLNNSGHLSAYDPTAVLAFVYDNKGRKSYLPSLDGNSWTVARGINDPGEVVGASGPAGVTGQGHGVLWSHGKIIDQGIDGYATKINNRGEVIGFHVASLFPYSVRAVRCYSGVVSDLGEGEAVDINNSGQIIGWNYDPYTGDYSWFLYSDGVKYDLSALISGTRFDFISLKAINDAGQILMGASVSSNFHTFLLTPVTPLAP